ncbi:hypothetical protein ANN_10520 [Periplaneta americana]|uniref:PHD-type domain-containing protein n=1 Tax=Periplaneta americana TaxID=6978 RepID=A0ABQ8TSE6_PERAM|nr:hypothetical protein ANN_10520 [Periplaneta americana]
MLKGNTNCSMSTTGTQNADSANCRTCKELISKDDLSVGCEGQFHKDCKGLSAGDYSTLKKPRCSLMWLCNTCRDDLATMKNGREELKALREEISLIRSSIQETMATEIRKAINTRPPVIANTGIKQRENKKQAPEPAERKEVTTEERDNETNHQALDLLGEQEIRTASYNKHLPQKPSIVGLHNKGLHQ